MNYIIYRHTSPSGKVYIGQTCQHLIKRWRSDGSGYVHCKYFYNAILKYGWENIKHEILFEGLTKQEADKKEIELITYYKQLGISYNLTEGGGGLQGFHHSEETKKLMSQIAKEQGRGPSDQCRKAAREYMLGRHLSEETKQKISKGNKGKKVSQESCEKIRQAKLGFKFSDESKQKMSKSHMNKGTKPVIQIDIKTNNVIQEWVSGIEVQRQLGIDSSAISKVCKGKLNQTGGFKWKYKE